MKKAFLITPINQLTYLSSILSACIAGVIVFFVLRIRSSNVELRILFSLMAVIILVLPTLVLHIRYYLLGLKSTLVKEGSSYTYQRKGAQAIRFNEGDMKKVVMYKRHKANEVGSNFYLGTWFRYFYLEIELRNGIVFKLPCLLFRNTQEIPFKYEIKDKSFPIY